MRINVCISGSFCCPCWTSTFWQLLDVCLLDCVCVLVVDNPLAAAVAEAEADGVVEVTKQLEKQAIEDKEKEEDGEEGDCLTPD